MRKPCFMFDDETIQTWMRDRFMRKLLSNKVDPKLDVRETLSRLHLNPNFTFPAVALLELKQPMDPELDKATYMEQVRDYLQMNIKDGSSSFLDEEGRVGLLFSWVSKEVLEKIRTIVNDRFEQPIHIGVGKPCSQLYDVHLSYEQAAIALRHKFYHGASSIIYYSELKRAEKLHAYPAEREKELYESFRAAVSAEEIAEAVGAFYNGVLGGGLIDIPSVYELTIRLLVAIEKRVLDEEDQMPSYAPLEIMAIVKLETLDEVKHYACGFLNGLWEVTSPNRKESHRSIIKKSMLYMEQECQYASLQSVAQKVYMTPTYLSLLFKNNTGKTFIEHLTDIRIDKAKDMLRSTHYKNYEVAEKVGYHDSRYFSQIFKRKVGVSPSEYRELICK